MTNELRFVQGHGRLVPDGFHVNPPSGLLNSALLLAPYSVLAF